jgi:putative membrane protein
MSAPRRLFPEDPRTVGEEPDYRFTLANERTFLAWIRTALALAAGGLGAIHLIPDHTGSSALGIALLGLSVLTAATAYRRWALNETSMRLGEPLPPSRLPQVIAIATALVAMGAVVFFVIDSV